MFYNREIFSITPSLFCLFSIIVAEVTSPLFNLNAGDVVDVKEFLWNCY